MGRRETPVPEPGPAAVDDPRLTFATPYRNVRPDIKYVGDQACADCHLAIAESYRHHPMGRALAPVAEADPIERYDAAARNPFATGDLWYTVERRDGRMVHRERANGADGQPVAEIEAE